MDLNEKTRFQYSFLFIGKMATLPDKLKVGDFMVDVFDHGTMDVVDPATDTGDNKLEAKLICEKDNRSMKKRKVAKSPFRSYRQRSNGRRPSGN